MKSLLHITAFFLFVICFTFAAGCRRVPESVSQTSESGMALTSAQVVLLTDTLSRIVAEYPAEIGVAVIVNNSDTILVNDRSIYPMMSVFKMHQAIALCSEFDRVGAALDSTLTVARDSLDANTWSPMLKEYTEDPLTISIRDLLRYALIQSDNNASNLMFQRLVGLGTTDSLIATLIPRHTFRIAFTEEAMKADHAKAYSNYTSPLAAAMLINRLYTDSIMSREKQAFIRESLSECRTGTDRIVAPLADIPRVTIGHKTGSGYSDGGVLAAHNDVAYVTLPDGTTYSLAVFVKDFRGTEPQASEAIARISAAVYEGIKLN